MNSSSVRVECPIVSTIGEGLPWNHVATALPFTIFLSESPCRFPIPTARIRGAWQKLKLFLAEL
jgi:hypothetical protein